MIEPVVRDCVCLERRGDGPHVADCDQRYRDKFFAARRCVRADFYTDWSRVRADFYGRY